MQNSLKNNLAQMEILCSIKNLISSLLNKVFPSELDYFLASFAILMSVFVGIISGFIPSYRAANLDPIDSLRYE